MEVSATESITSPQDEEVKGRLYGNISQHEILRKPVTPVSVYSLKKHSTDTELGMRHKVLSCDDLFDSKNALHRGKSRSLEILSSQTRQEKQVELLYEDVDAIVPGRGPPREVVPLKYDYISSSVRVEWRGSREHLAGEAGHQASRQHSQPSPQSNRDKRLAMDSLPLWEQRNLSQQSESAPRDTPLQTTDHEYEIFELDMGPVKRAKIKPPTPVKPSTLAKIFGQSKPHFHGYNKKVQQDAASQDDDTHSQERDDGIEVQGERKEREKPRFSIREAMFEKAPQYEDVN